jgi:hypothetical protein
LADVVGAQPGQEVSLAEWQVFPPQQKPFGMALPSLGRIEAEDYDTGGEGVAFHLRNRDPEWTAYRTDGASLAAAGDNRGWSVSGLTNGDWLSYTLDVSPTNLPSSLKLWGQGRGGPARLQVRLDGRVVGTAALPPGNGLEFATTVVPLTLNSGDFGRRVLGLEITEGLVDLDALELGGPLLTLARSNQVLTLKWTTAATNLVVEFCEDLPSSSWQPVTNRVSRSQNVNYQVTETMSSGSRLFRLRGRE